MKAFAGMDIAKDGEERTDISLNDFDVLKEYKNDFFEDFAQMITRVMEVRDKVRPGNDTLEDWIELSTRLELLHYRAFGKIANGMVEGRNG